MKKISGIILALAIAGQAYGYELTGYYEGQLTGYYLRDTAVWQQTNRLRLDINAGLGNNAMVAADVIAMSYFGEMSINLLDILPQAEANQLRTLFGAAADQVFTMNYNETEISLDNAFVTIYQGPLSVRIGRQQMPWGTGYAWNPTDVFNVKSLLDPTYEKPGIDAVKAEWGFGESGAITAVVLPGATWQDATKAGRVKINLMGFDVSGSYTEQAYQRVNPLDVTDTIKKETRTIIGGDLVGQILGAGLWAEGAWYKGPQDKEDWQIVVGMDNTFEFQTTVMLEYFRDSSGEADSNDYTLQDWVDLGLGTKKTLGRDYLMVMASHPLSALLTGTMMSVINLNDQSVILIPTLEYSYSDNLTLTLTGNILTGPGGSEYGQLNGSAGYLRAKAFF